MSEGGTITRWHPPELEDQPWLPAVFRDYLTDGLNLSIAATKVYEPTAPLIARVLAQTGHRRVVDLCAGGGGPWHTLAPLLRAEVPEVEITLTDRFPNQIAAKRLEAAGVRYRSAAVDAAAVPDDLPGLRTLFTSFHHFRPEGARAVLQDAVDAGAPVAIFEFTERRLGRLLPAPLLLPLIVWLTTPMIRPVTAGRLFWTYLVPVVPLMTTWDGIASDLRTYSPEELGVLIGGVEGGGRFLWEIGRIEGRMPVSYLLGYPRPLAAIEGPREDSVQPDVQPRVPAQ
jgi:hypothetical protein